ncbi:MAG: hypothetical protein WA966_16190 [Ornithinimicrobium sp.]
MNDIISAVSIIALSVLAVAAVGWSAIPKLERGRPGEVSATEWRGIVRTGARVVSSWGPRLDFSAPSTTVAPVRSDDHCSQS